MTEKRLYYIRLCLPMLLLAFLFICGCNKPAPKFSGYNIEEPVPQELLDIQELYELGETKKVCKKAKKWIKDNPDSAHQELALKIYADSLYDREKYYLAYLKYEELLNLFGATKYFVHAIDREIEIAKLFLSGQKRDLWKMFRITAYLEGLKILDDIDSRWPGSETAAKAIMLRADHFFDKEKFFEAEQEYHRIILSYNRSCHYPRALFRVAESKKNQYQGCYYDAVCLDEASVHYQQFQLRFPKRAARENVHDTLAWIRLEKVKKEHEIADFYYRTGKYKQARIYWLNVLEMAPETEYGQTAVKKIEDIELIISNPQGS